MTSDRKIEELEEIIKRQTLFLNSLQKKIEKMEREHRRMMADINRLERKK